MLVAIHQRGGVLAVEDDDIDGLAGVSTGVDYRRLVDRVAVREVVAEEVDEVLFVDLSFVALMADSVRGAEACLKADLFAGEGFLKKDHSFFIIRGLGFVCLDHGSSEGVCPSPH